MRKHQHYLLGPIQEWDDQAPHFVSAQGTKTTFRADMIFSDDIEDLKMSRTRARFELGAELFEDEHALLLRALQLWPNAQSRQALANYEKSAALADALNAAGIRPDTTCH